MAVSLYNVAFEPDLAAGVIRAFLEEGAGGGERLGELGTLSIGIADADAGQKVFHDWVEFWKAYVVRKVEEAGGRVTATQTTRNHEMN